MADDEARSTDHDDRREDAQNGDPSDSSPAKKRRLRIIIMIVALVALIAGLVWFIRYETVGKFMQSTDDAYIQADAVTVSPKVSGYVDRVLVADNQLVKAGQPLLQIDARDYRAQSAQFDAQIDVARANAQGVRAQIGEQEAAINSARADLASAREDAAFAHAEVARYVPLAASGAETREKLSNLRNQAQLADAKVTSASAALTSAERRVTTLRTQIRQAEAQGEAAQAQRSAADVNVGSTVLRASIAGRIGDKTVRVGQFVQAGTRTMSVVPVDRIYINANFKETQLGLMRVGQQVTVEIDALPGVEIPGTVESFSPGTGAQFSILPPQNATGNFTKVVQRVPVRIAIHAGPETRKLIVPGMSVDVTVDTRSAKGAEDRIRQEQEAHNERIGR